MSKGKDTMKHAAVYSGGAMLGRLISFLMLPFYAHVLRDIGYGVIGMLDVGLAFLVSLLAYGVRGSIVRLYHDETDPVRKQRVVSTGVFLVAAVSVALAVPFILFARPVSALLLADAAYSNLLVMALVAFIFDMTGQGASAWLLIRSRSMLFASINLLRLFVGLGLNIWLILIRDMGLDGYFISSLVTHVLTGSIMTAIALRDCGHVFDHEIAGRIRRYMLPLVPGALVSFISRQAERVLVRFQINMGSVGLLEMGYKFPILLAELITTPFMQSWNTRRYEIAEEPDAPAQIGRMYTYYLFLMVFAGLVMAVVIKPVLVLLTPPEFHLSYRIARVEIVTLILQGSYYHLSFGLYYAKHTGMVAKIRGSMAVLKVALSWFFISTWGIYGAAMSAAIIGLMALVLTFRLSQRRYRLELEWGKLTAIVGLGVGLFLLLSHSDWDGWSVFRGISGNLLPAIAGWLEQTPLGAWKDGKLPLLLVGKSALVTEILLKGLAALGFAVLLPVVHRGSLRQLGRLVPKRKAV